MVVLDANILLEILEERRYYAEVLTALEALSSQSADLAISTLTVSNTFYLAERHKVNTARVEILIKNYQLFDVLACDVTWALKNYAGHDFEDALQIAAAKRSGATGFITLDAKLAKKYYKLLPINIIV